MTNSKQVKEQLEHGFYDAKIISAQTDRYLQAVLSFEKHFGESDIEIFSAPGRTEICGNHTDHQHGQVLAASINLDAIAVVSASLENTITFISDGYAPIFLSASDTTLIPEEAGTTIGLIKGILKGFEDRNYRTGGFKAYVTSDVLGGSGLSSSAAIETLVGTILSGLYNDMTVSAVEIAQIGQFAENKYFGKPCGLMDQVACSVGGFVHIDFANPTAPCIEKINFDIKKHGYRLCIVDTKGSHADLTDEYASIPSEMKQIAKHFGKECLSEVSYEEFIKQFAQLKQFNNDRALLRALHLFHENKRVADAVIALQNNDISGFLHIIKQSGDSSFKYLQNVYTNKDVFAQPIPLALSLTESFLQDKGVCRVHGGGFAGTIQVFIRSEFVDDYKHFIENFFGDGSCHILDIRKDGGVKVL